MTDRRSTRREFLRQSTLATAAAWAAPAIVPASALGLEGKTAPSERVVLGCIGTGGKGRNNLGRFMKYDDIQAIAVCDVDRKHRDMAAEMVNRHYENSDCRSFHDFRELVELKELDAISIATPDHWHGLTAIAAANAGKDIYCEKPLTNSIAEGRAVCDAVRDNNVILQTGSHERSGDNARFACELVRTGRIGRLHTIRINLPCDQAHHQAVRDVTEVPPTMPIPEGFDYDFWLGHTAEVPYTERRCHFWWRFILAYGGGEMTDRGAHVIDLAQLGAGHDDTGPVEVVAKGTRSTTSLFDAFMDFEFVNRFANGVTMIGRSSGPRGVKFEGTDGSIFIHVHGARLEADPVSLLEETLPQDEQILGRSPGHHRNFVDCVKSRKEPIASAEVGHRTATICHLNNLAMILDRPLRWDPVKEIVVDDPEATAMLKPEMRMPWSLANS